jgi:peptidoglycan/LPS O-acetylase OafA/YrhL
VSSEISTSAAVPAISSAAGRRTAGRPVSGYIPTLDGWRAIAIIFVLFAHGGMYYFSDQGPHPSARLESWTARGSGGVDIFFAISGFLICSLLLREQTRNGRIDLKSFYIRRAFRILPPYLLYLAALSMLAGAGLIVVQMREWITCLLFVRNYVPLETWSRDVGWYTGHFWSLAVEEHFYMIWPATLLLLRPRRASIAAAVAIAAIAVWRIIDQHLHLVPVTMYENFEHRTDARLDALLWGCLAAITYATPAGRRWLEKLANPWLWLGSILVLLVLTSNFFDRTDGRIALALTLKPPLYAILVISTVVKPGWIAARFLEDARLRWIGRASYSLYIWQQLFLVVQLVPRPLPFGRWQEVPLAFICIFAAATASYYLIEQPLIRVGHRIARHQAASSAASSDAIASIASPVSSAPA